MAEMVVDPDNEAADQERPATPEPAASLVQTVKELAGVVRDLKDEVKMLKENGKTSPKGSKKGLSFPLDSYDTDYDPADPLPSLFLNPWKPSASQRQSSDTDRKFLLFSRLPPELRMRIWKLALPGGRIFEPWFDTNLRGGANITVAFTQGPNFNVQQGAGVMGPMAGGGLGANAAGANVNAPNNNGVAGPLPDPPPVRIQPIYPAPRIRGASREARHAAMEAGAFEFGLLGTHRRGYWLNHSRDIVFLRGDMAQPRHLQILDLTRIQILAFPHTQFKMEQTCIDILDSILNNAPRCRQVILFYDVQPRYNYIRSNAKSKLHPLLDNDVVGNHAFPSSRGIESFLPATWGDLRRVVKAVWNEHLASQGLSRKAPEFIGIDLIRPPNDW